MGAGGGVPGFTASGAAYDAFMGRYSNGLATAFAEVLGVREGGTALDVGCGPGALCDVLVARLGSASVSACDPSPGFVAECSARHPGVTVLQGRAEAVPFPDAGFDVVAAQLVFHFVTDPDAAVGELRRVARPGGTVGACVWDGEHGMEMLRDFWGAAAELDAHLPEEARSLRFGRPGELVELFERADSIPSRNPRSTCTPTTPSSTSCGPASRRASGPPAPTAPVFRPADAPGCGIDCGNGSVDPAAGSP